MLAATHSGKFHADDVLAWALIKEFLNPNATLIRTRDESRIQEADIVFDVGGIFDETTMRFDHHQSTYQGEFSSAGMVLHFLKNQDHISESLFLALKNSMVDYVDDVDNGNDAMKIMAMLSIRQTHTAAPCSPLWLQMRLSSDINGFR